MPATTREPASRRNDGGRVAPRPSGKKRLASLSLDLDNEWAYLKAQGDPAWRTYPSYLERLNSLLLPRLARRQLTITVFVVGQDAAMAHEEGALRALAEAGHEIANHSFHHEPSFGSSSRQQIEDEISRAELAIERATGKRPVGFRAPCFSISAQVLEVLASRGYLYDASAFPTFIGPLARAYYLSRSVNHSSLDRERLSGLYGRFSDGFKPLRPYAWKSTTVPLLEIPVTTMPVLRSPIHGSYLLWLASHSPRLAKTYLLTALRLCRLARIEPSILLHPLDLLGYDDVDSLRFFPGMDLPTAFKLQFFDETIDILQSQFEIVRMREHAGHAQASARSRPLPVPHDE